MDIDEFVCGEEQAVGEYQFADVCEEGEVFDGRWGREWGRREGGDDGWGEDDQEECEAGGEDDQGGAVEQQVYSCQEY